MSTDPAQSAQAHATPAADDEDRLNLAAVLAPWTGGRAFTVGKDRLPRQVPAAPTSRY